jgi:hypothetical protein
MLSIENIFLGHPIFCVGIKVDPSKIKVIMDLPSPWSQKEVRILLGNSSYYRIFIEKFTKTIAPMFKFLVKDVDFSWDSHCQNDFKVLKEKMSTTPVHRGPNWSLPFHICTDASRTTLGCVLGKKENMLDHVVIDAKGLMSKEQFLVIVY